MGIVFVLAISLILSADFLCIGILIPMFSVCENLYDINNCLSDKREFIRCLLQWQVWVWEETNDSINKAGIIILEVLMTVLALWCNVIALIMLIIGEIVRFLKFCFIKCFGK